MKEGSTVSEFSASGENGSQPSLSLELEGLLLERRVALHAFKDRSKWAFRSFPRTPKSIKKSTVQLLL